MTSGRRGDKAALLSEDETLVHAVTAEYKTWLCGAEPG
jgi:hypothetical protein